MDNADEQDQILLFAKQAMPEFHDILLRHQFTMERLAEIPKEIVTAVLDAVDNRVLAVALLGCTPEVSAMILERLPGERRQLVRSQSMALKTTVQESEIKTSVRTVMAGFKKAALK